MTQPRVITAPAVVDQYAVHTKSILDGERRAPSRAVLVEFYPDGSYFAQTYGMDHGTTTRELLGQVLQASEVLAGVAASLNAEATH